ncbi:hypothetical protein AC629_08965 [Bradyrhizobium sp. NAS80.1]|nr:hypothetical protein AC629_08965 [Bradyrhizobium sp. NAS80.1]
MAQSARDGFQAAVPRYEEPAAASVRPCEALDAVPLPAAAAWLVDGTPARQDAPWLAAPPDGPSAVVRPVEQPALPAVLVVHLFHVPGRARRHSPPAWRRQSGKP